MKNLYKAILCHALILILLIVVYQTEPRHAHIPSLGFFFLLLWPLIAFLLSVIAFVRLYLGHQSAKYSAWVHFSAMLILLIYLQILLS
jgi:hypothetical protein